MRHHPGAGLSEALRGPEQRHQPRAENKGQLALLWPLIGQFELSWPLIGQLVLSWPLNGQLL